jgi:DNA replication protein
MSNSFNKIRVWTEQKNIPIPSLFFKMYKDIGVSDQEALIVLHLIAFQAEGNDFPTPSMLQMRTELDQNTISMHYQRLIQKGLLHLTQEVDENGILYEKFSLYPIWERILTKLEQQVMVEESSEKKLDDKAIFTLLEQELGRLLSPIEIETVCMWLDQDKHSPEVIKEAVKEAVLANKASLRYIDRILFEWKKKQLKTVEQIQKHTAQFRQHTIAPKPNMAAPVEADNKPKSGFYNWLDERE